MHTPSESPVPPLATAVPRYAPKTPENAHGPPGGAYREPVTPGKDPASIDRRGLVGVGELATPRWVRGARRGEIEIEIDEQVDEADEEELFVMAMPDDEDVLDDDGLLEEEKEKRAHEVGDGLEVGVPARGKSDEDVDVPDSPWTIEAIDGEADDTEEASAAVLSVTIAFSCRCMLTIRAVPTALHSFSTSRYHPTHRIPHSRRFAASGPSPTRAAAKRSSTHGTRSACSTSNSNNTNSSTSTSSNININTNTKDPNRPPQAPRELPRPLYQNPNLHLPQAPS